MKSMKASRRSRSRALSPVRQKNSGDTIHNSHVSSAPLAVCYRNPRTQTLPCGLTCYAIDRMIVLR